MRIGVIGCGNVGFAFLEWLRNSGHEAIGYDLSLNVREKIVSQFGIDCAANAIESLIDCESIFICVPTEPAQDGSADLSIFRTVIMQLSDLLKNRTDVSVIQRSTCPPGSADIFSSYFAGNVSYGVNPSFLRKSSIKYDTEHPDRIAIGARGLALKHLTVIYDGIEAPRYVSSDYKSVELLKYVENTIDGLLMSYWNEIIRYAKTIGIASDEIVHLIELIGDREKFRSVSRVPGKAFGLWCIPKDLDALMCEMKQNGINPYIMEGIKQENAMMEKLTGIGTSPAQSLWAVIDNHVQVLEDGKKQIEAFYE